MGIKQKETSMKMTEVEEEEEVNHLHGDLLELIFALVPLIDLATACRVSTSWEHSVHSSLMHLNKNKPWLFIHTQCTRSSVQNPTHVYDPRTHTWLRLTPPSSPLSLSSSSFPITHASALRSSNSTFLYQISPTAFSFSTDPLHFTWRHVAPSPSWRVDPIVALTGSHIVVAGGGTSGFEDDPLSVEIYDIQTSQWSTCQSMPDILKDSAASTWLSVAANRDKMYVTEKASGITYYFSTETKAWSGPFDLRPDPSAFFSAIGFAGDDLILAAVIGHAQDVKSLKLWKTKPETMAFDQIGEIPSELLYKLNGENSELSSISLLTAKEFVYIYNNSEAVEIVYCEFGNGSCEWGSVKNLVLNDERRIGERMVMNCGMVGISDLHMATGPGNRKLLLKPDL